MPALSDDSSSTQNPEDFRATIALLGLTGLTHRSRKSENGSHHMARLLRLGGKRTNAAVNHNCEVASSSNASSSPPAPVTVMVWLRRNESDGRSTTTPKFLCSYPVTEESFDDQGNAVSWSCTWPYETSLIGFDFSSKQERTVAIGVGLSIPGMKEIQPLGVATVIIPENEKSEWNLSVSVDPMKQNRLFGKFSKPKYCEYTISPSTVFNMKLRVTRKASALRLYDVLVEKGTTGHSCDDDASKTDATSTSSKESTPELLGMNSSFDGTKPARISVQDSNTSSTFKEEEHFTAKDQESEAKKAAEIFPLAKRTLVSQRRQPMPAAIQYFSDKAREKKSMRKSAKPTEALKISKTATAEIIDETACPDSSDSLSMKTDCSLDNFFKDPLGQITQIDDVVLFPACDVRGGSNQWRDVPSMEMTLPQVKPDVIQMYSQDIQQPDQQRCPAQMCDVGRDKTSLADLVIICDKSHNSDATADDAVHSLQSSCEIPLMEIVVPRGKSGVICEDNVSMNGLDIGQLHKQNQAQTHDIACNKFSSAEVVFIHHNSNNSDSTCSVYTEICSGVEPPQKKMITPRRPSWASKDILKKKKEKQDKTVTAMRTKMRLQKMKNSGYCRESSPRLALNQMSSSSRNSLMNNDFDVDRERVELLDEEEDRFELKMTTVDGEIEQDLHTQVTRGTMDEDLLTFASSMDSTEVPTRRDYASQNRWTTVFEHAAEGCSDILRCGILSEEIFGGDDMASSVAFSDTSYTTNCNDSGEFCGYHKSKIQEDDDSFVFLPTPYDLELHLSS